MRNKSFPFLIVFLFSQSIVYAQSIANYSVTRNIDITYSSIENTGSAFNSWRNTGSYSQDDNRSYATDIGFDFWYNGTRYTQFSVSTNGYIDFSSSDADGGPTTGAYGYENDMFTGNGSGTWLALAPIYDDMTAQGGVDALGNSIKYLLSGTAPNRVLTVEWINMAVYQNTSPSLNFQVKLYETTGIIEFIYGTMTTGSHNFSYSCGINAATLSNTPSSLQLKMQQTTNSTTFNHTEKNNLTALPESNSQILFTPPSSPNPTGNLTFNNVEEIEMRLNWNNWSGNEVGYVIYQSTDNVNYTFFDQAVRNATGTTVSDLIPNTTYYWKVYAVTEGALSNPLSGSRATDPPGIKYSNTNSGNWNTNNSWTPSGIPTAAHNVIIRNGHTITVRSTSECNNLTITSGTLRIGDNNTNRTLTVNNDLTIESNGTLISGNSSATHTMNVGGNILNDGILDCRPTGSRIINLKLTRNGNQSLSGTGSTSNFNTITLDMGNSIDNTFEVSVANFNVQDNFLTLNNGTFKLSTNNSTTITPYTSTADIPVKGGLILNNPNATINFGAGIFLSGNLIVQQGSLNIGNASNENLESDGGLFRIEDATVSIAGRYYSTDINTLSNFQMMGGTLTLPTSSSTSTSISPFQINANGSTFIMSGGSIILQREGGSGSQDLGFSLSSVTNSSITGGTLQIGNSNTPSSNTFKINTSVGIYNLLVNHPNANAILNDIPLTVYNDVMLTAGNLNANNLDITLAGNWDNAGTFTPGNASVIFDGATGDQTITNSNGENFYTLKLNKASGKLVMMNDCTLGNNLELQSGNISINGNTLAFEGSVSGSGKFIGSPLSSLTINGNGNAGTLNFLNTNQSTKTLKNLKLNRTGGGSITVGNDSLFLIGVLYLDNGTLNTSDKCILLSNSTGTAQLATILSGSISGTVIAQRYIPGGSGKRRWRLLSAMVNQSGSIHLNQLKDDMFITGTGGSSNGFDDSPNNIASVKIYNETLSGASSIGWVLPSKIDTSIATTRGIAVFVRGDRNTTDPFDQFATPNNTTIDYVGNLNTGSYNISLDYTNTGTSYADGFNLVGNPYPATIDWNAANGITKTNIQNKVWVYNANNGSYGVFDGALGTGTNQATRYISSGQAFFVKANAGSASLNLTEQVKKTDALLPNFFRQAVDPHLLSITLRKDSIHSDETIFYFNPDNTYSDTDDNDAVKFFNDELNFYSKTIDGINMTINALPFPKVLDTVKLSVFAYDGSSAWVGSYQIESKNISNFDPNIEVYLLDTYLGTTTNLKSFNLYSFDINSESASMGNNRFKLIFKNLNTSVEPNDQSKTLELVKVYPNPFTHNFQLTFNNVLLNKHVKVNMYNTLGMLVCSNDLFLSSTTLSYNPPAELSQGIYLIEVVGESGTQVMRILKQ